MGDGDLPTSGGALDHAAKDLGLSGIVFDYYNLIHGIGLRFYVWAGEVKQSFVARLYTNNRTHSLYSARFDKYIERNDNICSRARA